MIKIKVGKKRLVSEEKIGDKFYLYHSTNTKADMSNLHSFRSGIRTDKNITSMAKEQGGGFYLWQNKQSALKRLKSSMVVPSTEFGGEYRALSKDKDGYPLLVTIEADELNPINFVADSEVSARSIGEVLLRHMNEIDKILKSLNQTGQRVCFKENNFPGQKVKTYTLVIPKQYVKASANGSMTSTLEGLSDYGQTAALVFYDLFTLLQEQNNDLYIQLMKEILADKGTDAIKYIGKEIIKPYKLEILDEQGNLIDVTNKDP